MWLTLVILLSGMLASAIAIGLRWRRIALDSAASSARYMRALELVRHELRGEPLESNTELIIAEALHVDTPPSRAGLN